ncbi:hypothetical protein PsYK624_023750 [Phanerochaete sordida]|uniref:Uncharacterized protein n=1 Tax=Phanerochaete sordida TaxID=48140 RepID=A0A9P3G252_9APHY|nr:hypothetical protein PsYK624_023750 [Phanerochaete sordida]
MPPQHPFLTLSPLLFPLPLPPISRRYLPSRRRPMRRAPRCPLIGTRPCLRQLTTICPVGHIPATRVQHEIGRGRPLLALAASDDLPSPTHPISKSKPRHFTCFLRF